MKIAVKMSMKKQFTNDGVCEMRTLAFIWIAAIVILDKTNIVSHFSFFILKIFHLVFFVYSSANHLKYSFCNQHVDISAPACIVSDDFAQSINWFREVKGCNQFFSFQSAFRACELSLCRCLNEEYNWVETVQMCMQHILAATHIDTFDEVFIVLKKYIFVGTISKRKSQKLHSWQCCKLIIPSFFVSVTIGASLYMVCLKHNQMNILMMSLV